jgi:glycosyltransferase involved in cell wall biosynthesis
VANENQPLFPTIGVIAQVHDTWGSRWQARHQVLLRLARYFHVVWMNPPRNWRESLALRHPAEPLENNPIRIPGFTVYNPEPWLPEVYRPLWLKEFILREHVLRARRRLRSRGCQKIIFSMWRPRLDPELKSVPFDLRCYHVDDEYSFSSVETPIGPDEMQILKGADQVFVTSRALLDKKGWVNANTSFVPNGVDYEAFAAPATEPQDLALLPHPRIGYAGFLKDQLDWTLLLHLSARHPDWHFVFLGPMSPHLGTVDKVNDLRKRSNVHFLEPKPTCLVPGYVQHFDVCIMPYCQNDYTKYIYPLKLHEYLASGRPTVGTAIRSLEEFSDVVALPRSADEWSAALAYALSSAANTSEHRAARQAVAKRHDWDLQVRKIAMTLAQWVAPELLAGLPTFSASSEDEDRAVHSSDPRPDLRTVLPRLSTAPVGSLESSGIHQSVRTAPGSATPIGPVLLVSPWYKPAVGGVAEVAERLHRTFAQAGVETHLLIAHGGHGGLQADPAVPNLWRWAAASSAFDRLSFKSLLGTFGRGALAYWRLNRFVRRQKIETIVLIYPIGYAWPFLLLRRATNVRIIASLHGNDVTKFDTYQSPLRLLIRQVLQSSDAIITCAIHLETKAQEICFPRALNIHLIPNCVDSTHFVPPPPNYVRSDSRPTFVHVSNFASKKRTVDIIEAFGEQCIPSNARLIMVGEGPDRVAATDRARSLGLSHRIEFVGSQKDVRPFLWEADAFVLASDDEGAPLVLLEAMACGLPWVSTAWGPAAMLPTGECGFVVPPRSPGLLAAAMAEVLKDPERRLAMGRRARHRAETDFREETYVERHLQLIRSLQPQTAESPNSQTHPRGTTGFQALPDASLNRPQPFTHEGVGRNKNDER